MTELVVQDTQDARPLVPVTHLAEWAESARQAALVATSIAKTPFVPQSLRGSDPSVTAANVTAAILTGQELGLEPMASLRSIDVIQGTPAMRAIALRALVQSAGHTVRVVESTTTRAVIDGLRRGEDKPQRSVWTMDRARSLGLAGKDNWRKQPQAMLVARATAEVCRLIAADVILGVPYAVEELEDGGLTPDAAPPRKRTAKRAPAEPAPTPEPEVEPPAPQPETGTGPELPEPDVDPDTGEVVQYGEGA